MSDNKKLWDPWKVYDVSPEELRAVKERAKIREELKAKWTRQFTNPWKGSHGGGNLFDPAVQKFISLKATQYEYFKGTYKSMFVALGLFVVPVMYITYATLKKKTELERSLRNGEVKYKDRKEKFFY